MHYYQNFPILLRQNLVIYFLSMSEIANNGNIDDISLIHYIFQVIDDSSQNKAVLFGCNNLIQFKEKTCDF